MTLVIGVLIGVVMGLTGAGGGVLAVPALVFGLGLTMQQAAPIALVGVAIAASVGAIQGLRRRVVRYRAAMLIAAAGLPASALGVAAAQHTPDLVLRVLFVLILLLVAGRQFSATAAAESESPEAVPASRRLVAELNPSTGQFVWTAQAATGFVGIGLVTGFFSGLLGVAGGFVLVPMLSHWTRLDARNLVGTSLLVTAMVTAFGAVAHALSGSGLPPDLAASFAAALTLGMLVGRAASMRVADRWTHRGFAALVLAVAAALAIDIARRLLG